MTWLFAFVIAGTFAAHVADFGAARQGDGLTMRTTRPGYEESLQILRQRGLLDIDTHIPQPKKTPQPEDEEPLGLSFYRMGFDNGADFSGLSIARTFFGRSELKDISFRGSDLTESNLRWNDFINVDFSEAVLVSADLRASQYIRVRFDNANLAGADLRYSDYVDCTFTGANMAGTLLAEEQREQLPLDDHQKQQVSWQSDHGPEPSGG